MTSKNKKADGPSCACGKTDLYEDWKKLNEESEEKDSDSGDAENAKGEDQK